MLKPTFDVPIDRRLYELTSWRVPGPVEPIPLLLFHRSDLPAPKSAVVYYHGVIQNKEAYLDTHPIIQEAEEWLERHV